MPEQTHQIPSLGPTLMHSFPAKACFLAPSPSIPRILSHSLFSQSLSGFHTTIRNGSQRMSELPSLSEIRLYYAIKPFKLAWREGSINISLGQMKDYILLY